MPSARLHGGGFPELIEGTRSLRSMARRDTVVGGRGSPERPGQQRAGRRRWRPALEVKESRGEKGKDEEGRPGYRVARAVRSRGGKRVPRCAGSGEKALERRAAAWLGAGAVPLGEEGAGARGPRQSATGEEAARASGSGAVRVGSGPVG